MNGPEGEDLAWLSVDWRLVEDDVRRLRRRIFTASQAGDLKRVRSLQKLMLRSRANALVSVRRVAEVNAGRETAGIDGKTALPAPQKAELADWVQHRSRSWSVARHQTQGETRRGNAPQDLRTVQTRTYRRG